MGMFDDIFGGGQQGGARQMRHGQQEAMGQYQSAYDDEMGYLNPNMGAGFHGLSLHDAMMNPGQFQNDLMGQYSESPQYQMQREAAEQAARNQMAASGLGGSTLGVQASGMAGQQGAAAGQQQYLQNAMSTLGMGMGLGGQMAGYRDQLGQRLGQGEIGMGEARAAELMGRAKGRQGFLSMLADAGAAAMGAPSGKRLQSALGAIGGGGFGEYQGGSYNKFGPYGGGGGYGGGY